MSSHRQEKGFRSKKKSEVIINFGAPASGQCLYMYLILQIVFFYFGGNQGKGSRKETGEGGGKGLATKN